MGGHHTTQIFYEDLRVLPLGTTFDLLSGALLRLGTGSVVRRELGIALEIAPQVHLSGSAAAFS